MTPTPAPAPAPKPKPVKHPPGTHVVTTQLSTSAHPNQSKGLSTLTLPIVNPPPATVPVAENLNDGNLWLLTALLPTLMVLWLLIAARTLTEGLRRRRRAAPAA